MTIRFLTTTSSQEAILSTVDGNPYPVAPAEGGSGPIPVVPPLYSVVLRPGDTSGADNVFTSWAALYAACSAIKGGVRVSFDDALGAITMPAGAYNIDGWYFANGNGQAVLTIANGASASWRNLWVDSLTITYEGTADFFEAAADVNLYVLDGAVITTTTTGNFLSALGASAFVFVAIYPACDIGDGTHFVFTNHGSGASLEVFMTGGTYENNVQSGGSLDYDASVFLSTTNLAINGVTLFATTNASEVAYSPAVPGNWNPAPTTAAGALDTLAAHHVVTHITVDQPFTTNTPVAATGISFPMAAGDVWAARLTLSWTNTVADKFPRIEFTVPTGATGTLCVSQFATAAGAATVPNLEQAASVTSTLALGITTPSGGAASVTAFVTTIDLLVVGDGTHAGTVQLEAQQGTAGDNVTLKAGSFFAAWAE